MNHIQYNTNPPVVKERNHELFCSICQKQRMFPPTALSFAFPLFCFSHCCTNRFPTPAAASDSPPEVPLRFRSRIHVAVMVILAKVLKMDIFTCAVASLANIGRTATAPVLAGAYSSALVPVGIVMALLEYVIGTGGGLLVANLMRLLV